MMDRSNLSHNLMMVDMLIRALADEMAIQKRQFTVDESRQGVVTQIEEALYELRIRKMLLKAIN